ncbi:hypothetical protein LTR66_004342 [Elasticomyces elasticus]|nr:hypothetical protein LTR66_004342 [Elasticomyces elasticus]
MAKRVRTASLSPLQAEPPAFRFTDLCPELRLMIYRHLLPSGETINLTNARARPRTSMHKALFLVNKEMHAEVAGVVYGENRFELSMQDGDGLFPDGPVKGELRTRRFNKCRYITTNTAPFLSNCDLYISFGFFKRGGDKARAFERLQRWLVELVAQIGKMHSLRRLRVFFLDDCFCAGPMPWRGDLRALRRALPRRRTAQASWADPVAGGPYGHDVRLRDNAPVFVSHGCHEYLLEPLAELRRVGEVQIEGDLSELFRERLIDQMTNRAAPPLCPLIDSEQVAQRIDLPGEVKRRSRSKAGKLGEPQLDWEGAYATPGVPSDVTIVGCNGEESVGES